MNAFNDSTAWLLASCFGLSIVSALVPWLNGEAIVLGFAAASPAPAHLVMLALTAAFGQTLGKCVLYYAGSGVARVKATDSARVERWRQRLRASKASSLALVFVSSTVGIPPLYLTTIAAGTVGMAFPRFITAAALGRVVRFSAVVLVPGLLMRAWG